MFQLTSRNCRGIGALYSALCRVPISQFVLEIFVFKVSIRIFKTRGIMNGIGILGNAATFLVFLEPRTLDKRSKKTLT